MADIFVLAEHRQGVLREITGEALTAGRKLADQLGGKVVAVLLGHHVGQFASELAKKAHKVLHVDSALLGSFNAEPYQRVMARLIKEHSPAVTLIGHTGQGVDLAAPLATELDLPLVTDCIDIALRDGRVHGTRQLYTGKIQAEISFGGIGIVTVRAGTFPQAAADLAGEIVSVPSIVEGEIDYRRFHGYVEAVVGDVDITQAPILVSVGRGIKEEANLAIVKALADAIGAVLSGSRPVVDAGWLQSDRQVGSSGKTVKPKLYLAIGISGAFQHVVGMKGAETIVAINKDPNAPIFSVADYGIVGDLFKIVPALTAKVKELKGA